MVGSLYFDVVSNQYIYYTEFDSNLIIQVFKRNHLMSASDIVMRGSTQRKALATRSVEKKSRAYISHCNPPPQYWCQNDHIDEGFQMVRHVTRSDTIMMELTKI